MTTQPVYKASVWDAPARRWRPYVTRARWKTLGKIRATLRRYGVADADVLIERRQVETHDAP